jgi:hypothetical protein
MCAKARALSFRLQSLQGAAALVLTLLVVTIAIYRVIPFGDWMPDYLVEAQTLAAGQRLPNDTFTPVGYPLLIAGGIKFGGIAGIICLQSAIYIATVIAAWWVFCNTARRAGVKKAALGSLAMLLLLAFHPYMLLDTHRVDDNAFNVLFMVILANWCQEKFVLQSLGRALFYGAALGLFTTLRPNAAVFAVLPIIALLFEDTRDARSPTLRYLPVFGVMAAVLYGVVVFAATGMPFFWPATGPYNFFAGNNAYSFNYLIQNFNAEYSINPALDALGVVRNVGAYQVEPQLYVQLAWQFISHHVVGFIALCFTKLLVLFAPRVIHSQNWFDVLVQVLLSFPVLAWTGCLVIAFRAGMRNDILRRLIFVSLFVLPFVLTNADPHYRLPLDIWFLIDLALLSQQIASLAADGGKTRLIWYRREVNDGMLEWLGESGGIGSSSASWGVFSKLPKSIRTKYTKVLDSS